jgi:hypothetical protein
MAKRRRTRRRSTTAPRRRSTGIARKTTRRRRSTGLAAGFGMSGLKGAAINTAKGAAGGILFALLAKAIDKDGTKPENRLYAGLIGSMVAGMFLKQPAIAAGIAGSIGVPVAQKMGFLNDDDYAFLPESLLSQKAIASSPMYINDDGEMFQLAENGQVYPLAASGNFSQIYPGYNNPGMYDQY